MMINNAAYVGHPQSQICAYFWSFSLDKFLEVNFLVQLVFPLYIQIQYMLLPDVIVFNTSFFSTLLCTGI